MVACAGSEGTRHLKHQGSKLCDAEVSLGPQNSKPLFFEGPESLEYHGVSGGLVWDWLTFHVYIGVVDLGDCI